MKRIIALVVLLLMFGCSSVLAQSVTAVGVGTAPSEAEQDAMRNAVEQVMGTLVDSNTLVRNAQLVEDNIYTTSRGFIESYNVTDKRMEGGLWHITIAAEVNTAQLARCQDRCHHSRDTYHKSDPRPCGRDSRYQSVSRSGIR